MTYMTYEDISIKSPTLSQRLHNKDLAHTLRHLSEVPFMLYQGANCIGYAFAKRASCSHLYWLTYILPDVHVSTALNALCYVLFDKFGAEAVEFTINDNLTVCLDAVPGVIALSRTCEQLCCYLPRKDFTLLSGGLL